MLRIRYIQKIGFLSSAFMFVETMADLIILLLLITKIEPYYEALLLVFFRSYLFIYLLKLLKVLDSPFQQKGKTMDDVSLFLLDEFEDRLSKAQA